MGEAGVMGGTEEPPVAWWDP